MSKRTKTLQAPYTSPPRIYPLDVVLACGSHKRSKQLCALQTVRFGQKVSFSHVILAIQPGVYLHSTTDAGVHFARPADIWESPDYEARKLVLRNTALHTLVSQTEIIETAIKYSHEVSGDRYNYFISLPKRVAKALRRVLNQDENALFCSELAAKVLLSRSVRVVPSLPPEQIWPGHFEHQRNDGSWMDVTPLHATYAELCTIGKDLKCVDPGAKYCFEMSEYAFDLSQNLHTVKLGNRKLSADVEESRLKFDEVDQTFRNLLKEKTPQSAWNRLKELGRLLRRRR